jgi:hypothetical protein
MSSASSSDRRGLAFNAAAQLKEQPGEMVELTSLPAEAQRDQKIGRQGLKL